MATFQREWTLPSGKRVWLGKDRAAESGRLTGRWRPQVYVGKNPTTGKPVNRNTTCTSEKAARKWANDNESKRDDGVLTPAISNATFAHYLRDTWLPTYGTQVRSIYNTERTLTKWILNGVDNAPRLGRIPLSKLQVDHFDRLYRAMADNHRLQRRGIEHLHGLLKRSLKYAVAKGHLTRNPTEGVTIPKPEVRAEVTRQDYEDDADVRYLDEEKALRLKEAARLDRWAALWFLLLDAGLRPGEAFAMRWSEVDLDAGVVKVRATLTRVGVDKRERGWKLMKTKTKKGKRDVTLSEDTVWQLRKWQSEQVKQKKAVGPEWQDHGFVFTSEVGTPLGNNTRRAWAHILKQADGGRGDLGEWGPERTKPRSGPTPERSFTPYYRLYALRHTSATLLLVGGMSLLEVSRRLGHENLNFTAKVYGHVQAKDSTKAREIWKEFFAKQSIG